MRRHHQEAQCPGFPASTAANVAPEIAALYDKVFALRGNVPNMFRVMAHRPEIFATMQAHFAAVLNTGTVSTKLKELIIVRTSQVNETPYCLASHTILARNLGWTDEQLSHLADWPAATTSLPPKRLRCVSPKPSRATPTPSPTSSSPSCAAFIPKAKSSSCSAPSASSTTSTASTTRSKWSRPSPARAAHRNRRPSPLPQRTNVGRPILGCHPERPARSDGSRRTCFLNSGQGGKVRTLTKIMVHFGTR